VQLSYGVGEEYPLALAVQTFGTGTLPDEQIERALEGLVDLRPARVVENFGLCALPERNGGEFYRTLAAYGHFGRADVDAPWEREDLVAPLRRAAGRVS
jgi:S-adenosylmethionine synthetase